MTGADWLAQVVAEAVASKLAQAGSPLSSAVVLLEDPQLSERNFAALGLNSIDWMEVATAVEDALGVEIPDELLLDEGSRSVAGWSRQLQRLCQPGYENGEHR